MTNKEKLMYLAGILDGEGCFSAITTVNGRKEKHLVPDITIIQNDIRLLEWIKLNYGGSVHILSKNTKVTAYQWHLRGTKAKLLAELVQPYLIVKDKQVYRCINTICTYCGSTYTLLKQ